MKDSMLEELVHKQLGSIAFVRDYLQLDFGDARFNAFAWPLVTTGETTLTFGDPGYRDALRAFIDHEVLAAWLPRLARDGAAWLVVQKNLGSDLLARWIAADLGLGVERTASSKGFRVLRVTR